MITVGITGRSGCGKSTVTQVVREHGYSVSDGDALSREILQKGSPILPLLCEAFGADILETDGSLKRRMLADRAFKTQAETAKLNSITHPEILRRMRQAQQEARAKGDKLFFIDGAVIVDTPFEALCDRLLLITVPTEVSVERIIARDGISREMALRRLSAQPSEEYLKKHATHLLANTGTKQQLQEGTKALLQSLLAEEAE